MKICCQTLSQTHVFYHSKIYRNAMLYINFVYFNGDGPMLGKSSKKKMLVSCDLTHLTVLILSNIFFSHSEENIFLY